MRIKVQEHSKVKLAKKIVRMAEKGWEPVTKVMNMDQGLQFGTVTYMCILENKDHEKENKWSWEVI